MAKQRPKQRAIVERVMHEFKQGHLDSSSGQAVENPRQAIAIALHEASVSRDETSAGNRQDQARTKASERHAGKGRQGDGKTCAALQAEAAKRGNRSRSRMSKAQLTEALGRR